MNIVAKSDLNFQGKAIVPVAGMSGIWLTSAEIAAALQYKSAKSVTNLFNQNADEFTGGMTKVIESVTSGNYRKKVRVFSLRGAHLIAMFARTPVAKEFRKWVLDILDRGIEATSVENLPTEFHQRVMLYFDSKGGVIGTQPLTEDQVVMSFDGFVNLFRGKGWLVAPKEEVAKGLIGAIQSLP
ncbi:Bro-N domain-containing protein [Enterobacter sp. RHBSTW-00175]|uniref:BRO-N domain-containing protein n=1 Tax=Enterobacter sp. RHBSTW-00175 TaxID=2742639 RepID=UPI0015E9E587|nr:Bro-N domain-containing protein [Enterobacter sp. RHBSTW-00175]QMR77951.1 Bro-N domain-containing protein [Enterobacter sp. RHBSTW-00175]